MQTSVSSAEPQENAAPPEAPLARRRFKQIGVGLFVAYALAIAQSNGEFWPFSKFPMFSRAGKPWNRSYVTEVSASEAAGPLAEAWANEVPGKPVPLHHHQINQDDLSAVVRGLKPPLTTEQTDFLATYFDRLRHEKTMILYGVSGRFRRDRSVRERYLPLAIIGPDGVRNVVLANDASVDGATAVSDAGAAPAPASSDGGVLANDAGVP